MKTKSQMPSVWWSGTCSLSLSLCRSIRMRSGNGSRRKPTNSMSSGGGRRARVGRLARSGGTVRKEMDAARG